MDEDTLQKAQRIKADLGIHEIEVSCGGEADLHRGLNMCTKNPGHKKFIPIRDFNKTHLPTYFQDDDRVEWIRTHADLTVRVSVEHISNNRPEYFPDGDTPLPFPLYNHRDSSESMRTGTGTVGKIFMFTEKDNKTCQCKECGKSQVASPKCEWGEIIMETAAHVVFDQNEAEHTSCRFFYDDSKTDKNTLLTLSGMDVLFSDARRDLCRMKYITHDVETMKKLNELCTRRAGLWRKVRDKYGIEVHKGQSSTATTPVTNPEHRLAICVSHPHGCSKQISFGVWTHRHAGKKGEFCLYGMEDMKFDSEETSYTYNTPTCPGSSGALIFSPVRRWISGVEWERWGGLAHTHMSKVIQKKAKKRT